MLSRLDGVACGAGVVATGMMPALPAAYLPHVPVGLGRAGPGALGIGRQAWEVARRARGRGFFGRLTRGRGDGR
jgi:hypothetical protein